MPEIHPNTGNYHDRQEIDVYWSVLDRLFTPIGTRQALPGYGFPYFSWPQLPQPDLQEAVTNAVRGDELVDRVGYEYSDGHLTVDIVTDQRVGGW